MGGWRDLLRPAPGHNLWEQASNTFNRIILNVAPPPKPVSKPILRQHYPGRPDVKLDGRSGLEDPFYPRPYQPSTATGIRG